METAEEFQKFVDKASLGLVNQFEGDCNKQQARLAEFLTKQNQLLSTLEKELAKFKSSESLQLEDMMAILKTCQARLQVIKERMRKASTSAAKLKARSLRILQIKQKEALDREHRREALLTREQEMVAKSPLSQDSVISTKPANS